jgi:hypothetical protein
MLFSVLLVQGTAAFLIFRFVLCLEPGATASLALKMQPISLNKFAKMITPNGLINLFSFFSPCACCQSAYDSQ